MERGRIMDRFKAAARSRLERLGWRSVVPEAQRHLQVSYDPSLPLPKGAARVLRTDNPQLVELRRQYARLDWPVCRHTFWSAETIRRDLQLPWFRGDNAFIWQYRQLGADAARKMSTAHEYIRARDQLGLLSRLREDGLFGCWTFPGPQGERLSRDLLESVNEINFLERHLNLSRKPQLRLVDIGAGYGRLAHRLCEALPSVERYDCLDSVAESTFLCDYYLKFRGVRAARSVPLTQVETVLPGGGYQLALNIHSFSECTYEGIQWWLRRLAADRTQYLLIVPNHYDELWSAELDGSRRDYAPLLDAAGYRLVQREPIFNDAKVQAQVGVRDFFMLYRFERP